MTIKTKQMTDVQFSSGSSVTLSLQVRPTARQRTVKTPTLAQLNADMSANAAAYRADFSANCMKLTGKPNL